MKKKVVALILSAMLVLGVAMGATLAWLTDTATVTNTFTPSDVDITLTETDNTAASQTPTATGNTYKMVPGTTLPKDPKVTVSADSEKCFVFVKIDGSALTKTVLNTATSQNVPLIGWSVAGGWTALAGETNVYWRIVEDTDAAQSFYILADNQVTISEYATKSDMNAIADSQTGNIAMNFTAYAVQYENVAVSTNPDADAAAAENAALAWAKRVEPTTP